MSFSKEKRAQIKNYMLKKISDFDAQVVEKTCETFDISENTVYRYLKELQTEEKIEKRELHTGKQGYCLKTKIYPEFVYLLQNQPEETRIYRNDIEPLLAGVNKNTEHIWNYAFSEMMNNAIEHSNATAIYVNVQQDSVKTCITITDNGVGIFQKIQNYFKEQQHREITLDEAVAELFAGKFTTDASHHSGEGIFFSSRAVDFFSIESDGHIFTHDRFQDDFRHYVAADAPEAGTLVCMVLENQSSKQLSDIFDAYSNQDRGFYKTHIPMVEFFSNGNPVSRSEARRLADILERFEEVQLDFKNIETLGQGFTHELFVVFHNYHPEIKLEYVNACEAVDHMIRRVLVTEEKRKEKDTFTLQNAVGVLWDTSYDRIDTEERI